MKKILIVFYSLTGSTKFIAEQLAKDIGAELLQLHPKQDIQKTGFMKYIRGGKQVLMKSTPELEKRKTDINLYETIIIGTPVRAYTYTPAIRTFLTQQTIKNKKIALFCCHEGGKGKALENMETALTENSIIAKKDFFSPLKKKKEDLKKEIQERRKSFIQ